MDELVYQVTRDAEGEEDLTIGIWDAHAPVRYNTNSPQPYWETDHPPLAELTVSEFEEAYGVVAPAPGERIFIATYCKWERVAF